MVNTFLEQSKLQFYIMTISILYLFFQLIPFLAHLNQGLIGELTGYPWSVVRRRPFTFSNVFSSETARPIKVKFYMEPPWEGGTNVYINNPGHMTKMAAMPIYGQNLYKFSSPEPEVLCSWNLACSIRVSSSTKFTLMMTLG